MKHLCTLLLLACAFSAAAQKPDSTKSKPADTLKINLLEHDAYSRLLLIDQQRGEIKGQAEALKARMDGLDAQHNSILDGEVRHSEKVKNRKVMSYYIEGTSLVLLLKKVPDKEADKKKPK